jgi:hypothetical protein
MGCSIRQELEHARRSVDVQAYHFHLGSAEFDRWLAESNALQKALEEHIDRCPVCKRSRAAFLVA